jgi:hypothetical protein
MYDIDYTLVRWRHEEAVLAMQISDQPLRILPPDRLRTTLTSFDIIQFTSRTISLGALIARFSGSKSSGDSRARIGPGSLVKRESLFAKQVYSVPNNVYEWAVF